jgi:hypothetical protein
MYTGLTKFCDGVRAYYRRIAAQAWVPGDKYNILRRAEVWNEPFMWGRHINMGVHNPRGYRSWVDPTQYGYIPARLGADAYAAIFRAAFEGARSANPHLQLGGPSAPGFGEDDYGVFENYVAPILDQIGKQLDFLTEHHYGGRPATYPASYEVVTAYMDLKHNRRIPIYNTECNDLGGDALDRAHYNIEEILHIIRDCPDKVRGRAMHALWRGKLNNQGELDAYRFLAPLRGLIIEAESGSADVLCVAAQPQPGTTVAAMFNRGPHLRTLDIPLPAGHRLKTAALLTGEEGERSEDAHGDTEGLALPAPDGATRLQTDFQPSEKDGRLAVRLPSRAGLCITLENPGHRPERLDRREQAFADVLLQLVRPGEKHNARVRWRGRPGRAQRAWLRLVTSDVHRGEGCVEVNGHRIALPWSSGNNAAAVIQDIPLPPESVTHRMKLRFSCVDTPRANGYRILAASVIAGYDDTP